MDAIVKWPDPRLETVCDPVPHGEGCRDLIERMFAILAASANGVGLAAPQIGVMKRVIVCRVPVPHPSGGTFIVKHAIINPQITWAKGALEEAVEGCLSFPDHKVSIPRYPRITVSGYSLKWEPITRDAKGLVARVLQHEIDHLNGRTIAWYAQLAYEIDMQNAAAREHELSTGPEPELPEKQLELPL
jgi:peptide deformylase